MANLENFVGELDVRGFHGEKKGFAIAFVVNVVVAEVGAHVAVVGFADLARDHQVQEGFGGGFVRRVWHPYLVIVGLRVF